MTLTSQASSQAASSASGPPPVPTPALAQKTSMPPPSAVRAAGTIPEASPGTAARADLGGDLAGGVGVEVVDRHPGALGGESAGQGGADPAARSGDDHPGVVQCFHDHGRVSLDSATRRSVIAY